MDKNSQVYELLKHIAQHSPRTPNECYWQQEAFEILLDEYEHLADPPTKYPICGGALARRISKHGVEVLDCWTCDWIDEWDLPDPYNPAAIRY